MNRETLMRLLSCKPASVSRPRLLRSGDSRDVISYNHTPVAVDPAAPGRTCRASADGRIGGHLSCVAARHTHSAGPNRNFVSHQWLNIARNPNKTVVSPALISGRTRSLAP